MNIRVNRYLLVAITLLSFAAAALIWNFGSGGARADDPVALGKVSPAADRHSSPSDPTPPPYAGGPDVCGMWSSNDPPSALAEQLGEIRSCMKVGSSWLITVENPVALSGVWMDQCSVNDSTCLDGQADHPASDFHLYPAPLPGGVVVLGQASPTSLIVDVGGYQWLFDVTSGTFSRDLS
jgi:hypothetical protein